MKLISLAFAKSQIEMDHDEDDLLIDLYIQAASESIVNYLKSGMDPYLDSAGEVEYDSQGDADVPAVLKVATMFMVAVFYKNRDVNDSEIFTYGYLPQPVMSLLHQLRSPALA